MRWTFNPPIDDGIYIRTTGDGFEIQFVQNGQVCLDRGEYVLVSDPRLTRWAWYGPIPWPGGNDDDDDYTPAGVTRRRQKISDADEQADAAKPEGE